MSFLAVEAHFFGGYMAIENCCNVRYSNILRSDYKVFVMPDAEGQFAGRSILIGICWLEDYHLVCFFFCCLCNANGLLVLGVNIG